MKCHVPGQNVKVLSRSVRVLARFGDELYLEPSTDSIAFKTINATESAYAMIKFNKNFFSYFNHNYYSTEDNERLKCKISMKSALNTFKSPAHMDKQVENLEIKLDPEMCKLIFQIRCKHGIVKTHYVSILDCKILKTTYIKDLVPNRITAHHRILSEALTNFQTSEDLVTLEVKAQSLLLRNFIDTTEDFSKLIRSQINIKPSEFDTYSIGVDTAITFSLKEFRALLAFAEALNLPLQLLFETTGKPAVFVINNGTTFDAHFVLATNKINASTQTTTKTHNTTVERNKRKETTPNYDTVRKKPHLDDDVSKCLDDEDSHLFNFIDIPEGDTTISLNNNVNGALCNVSSKENNEKMDCDNIPASPTSRAKIKSVFTKCFEKTFDYRSVQHLILAENSDSE